MSQFLWQHVMPYCLAVIIMLHIVGIYCGLLRAEPHDYNLRRKLVGHSQFTEHPNFHMYTGESQHFGLFRMKNSVIPADVSSPFVAVLTETCRFSSNASLGRGKGQRPSSHPLQEDKAW